MGVDVGVGGRGLSVLDDDDDVLDVLVAAEYITIVSADRLFMEDQLLADNTVIMYLCYCYTLAIEGGDGNGGDVAVTGTKAGPGRHRRRRFLRSVVLTT